MPREPDSTLVDRVKVYVISSGTGAFVLGEAIRAYRGVEALRDGETYSYAAESSGLYEVGRGEYVASLNSLSRSPTSSSNGGAVVDFPTNTELAFTALASDLSVVSAYVDAALAVGFGTWAELQAFADQMQPGDETFVSTADTGSHSDPLTALTVTNSGVYQKQSGYADPVWLRPVLAVEAAELSKAWAQSPTAPDPSDPTSKSAKTIAGDISVTAASLLGTRSTVAVLLAGGSTFIPSGMPNPPTAGVTNIGTTRAYIASATLADGRLEWVEVYAFRAGIMDLILWSGSGVNAAVVWRQTVTVLGTGFQKLSAGVDFTPPPLVNGAWRIGGYQYANATGNAIITIASGGVYYYRDGDPGAPGGASMTFISSGQTVQMRVGITTTPTDIEAVTRRIADNPGNRSFALQRSGLPSKLVGASAVSGTLAQTSANQTIVYLGTGGATAPDTGTPALLDTMFLDCTILGSGQFDIATFDTVVNNAQYTATSRTTVTLVKTGEQTLYSGLDFSSLKRGPTQLVGIIVPTGGPQFRWGTITDVGNANGSANYTGDPGLNVPFAVSASAARIKMAFTTVPDIRQAYMPLASKLFLSCGDSFTQNFSQTWAPYLQEVTGMTMGINRGVNGQSILTFADNVTSGDVAAVDVVLMFGGTNSWANNRPKGNPDDPAGTASISGDVKVAVGKIRAFNALKQIVFVTSPYRGTFTSGPAEGAVNGAGDTLAQAMDMVAQSCARIGVPCLNLYANSGWCHENIGTVTVDQLHPTLTGGRMLGLQMGRFWNRFAT